MTERPMSRESALERVDAFLRAHRQRHLDALFELLRIPSVSALPEHAEDVRAAADWVVSELARAGATTASVVGTGGHPAVLGFWRAGRMDAPTVLIYGHFDVQPVDPIAAWTSPPFEPMIRDGRLFARGATDDKGNMLAPVRAAEALVATTGSLPLNLVFLFDGEEEIGSPNLLGLVRSRRDELRADGLISADGVMFDSRRPSVMLGFKGLLSIEVRVSTAAHDLHSGVHGGMAPNAALAIAQLIASLVAPDGTILVDGLATTGELSASQREQLAAMPFDAERHLAESGYDIFSGEPGHQPLERNWHRTTLDVAGIWGGFQGPGTKTIIPGQAGAKITCRLAPGMSPQRAAELLRAHLDRHAPPGATVNLDVLPAEAEAFDLDADDPVTAIVGRALHRAHGMEPLAVRSGASLPIAGMFERELGLRTVMLGWTMPDENLHAPDEFYRLESFDRGPRVYADVLLACSEGLR